MAPPPQLSIESLPAWATLQDVKLQHVGMRHVDGKGYGLVAEVDLNAAQDVKNATEIMKIPAELVLSGEAVDEYTKVDHNFKHLIETVGRKVSHTSNYACNEETNIMYIVSTIRHHAVSLGTNGFWQTRWG